MKVAVCLSGQPRAIYSSWESILDYFNSSEYTVDYFCHTWDWVTWKIPHSSIARPAASVPPEALDLIRDKFKPVNFMLGARPDPIPEFFPQTMQNMFLSMAYANHMRRKHEEQNNFEYDWVIKARYDLVFPWGAHWSPNTGHKERQICISHMNRLPHEYRRINFSDVIFYGDSWGMDIASDVYFRMQYPSKLSPQDHGSKLGPGTMMAEYMFHNNVICTWVPPEERILRFESRKMDPKTEWEEIDRIHWSYYHR